MIFNTPLLHNTLANCLNFQFGFTGVTMQNGLIKLKGTINMNIVLTCNYYSFTIIILQFFDCNITIVILQLNYNNINSIIQGYISQIYWIQTFIESIIQISIHLLN